MTSEDGQNDSNDEQKTQGSDSDAIQAAADLFGMPGDEETATAKIEAGGQIEAEEQIKAEEPVEAKEQASDAQPAVTSTIGMNRGANPVAPKPQAPPVPEKTAAELRAEKKAAEKAEKEKEEEVRPVLPELEPHRAALPWYVVHTYSGFEMRVKASLEERVRTRNLTDKFGNIVVPQETVVELVRGQKKTSTKKFFPGYILVQMHLDDETWHLVKDTPKVTEFVGDSRNPSPLTKEEVASLIQQMEGGGQRPRSKVQYEVGDAIKVIDGPFAEFNGTVDDVKPDKGKLRVLISIFGRNTPVELDFVQVEKV